VASYAPGMDRLPPDCVEMAQREKEHLRQEGDRFLRWEPARTRELLGRLLESSVTLERATARLNVATYVLAVLTVALLLVGVMQIVRG
jgi:hypothetical protein